MSGTTDIALLPVFEAVAAAGSFSVAARQLGLPKSSVSRKVARLEAELGVRLLQRTTRRVGLSTAGLALRERLVPALAALRQVLGDMPERDDEPSGELRFAAPLDFGSTCLAALVAEFTRRHPAVRIDLRLSSRQVDLVAESVDLALRVSTTPQRDSSLVIRKVGLLSVGLFASSAYLAARGTPRRPADLEQHDWLAFSGMPATLRFTRRGRVTPVRLQGRIACDDLFFLREVAREGAGIAALPGHLSAPDVRSGRLVPVLPGFTLPGGRLLLVLPARRLLPPKVAVFRDFLVDALRERGVCTAR